ncbi:MAG: esterase, partial [Bryobacterales bacterium]|nr:esterase [Bryobacterales bacterium]
TSLKLLWIAIGRDDFLLDRNRVFQAALEAAGVEHTYEVTAGGHSWPIWRDYLADFVPLLFRATE